MTFHPVWHERKEQEHQNSKFQLFFIGQYILVMSVYIFQLFLYNNNINFQYGPRVRFTKSIN